MEDGARSIAAELGRAWVGALAGPALPLGLVLGALAVLAVRRQVRATWAWAAVLPLGLALAWRQASVVDDAFISFRYAAHLLAGDGLVYNVAERVEGYTNLLWTVLVAAGTAVTGAELPLVALALGGAAYVANVAVCARFGRALAGDGAHLPLAAALLAVQYTFTSFATTGLETGAAALAVQLGALALVTGRPLAAGLGFTVATLLRPDQLLFWLAGGVVLGRDLRAWRWYAAPLALLAASELWRVTYYGDWLPNTLYAKASGLYGSQGLVYAAEHHLGGHLWLVLAVALAGAFVPPRSEAERRLRRFALAAIPLVELYVLALGGDFMAGRFYVSLWPIALLGAEGAAHALAASPRGWAAGLVLGATLRGGSLVPPHTIRWYLADEGTVYPLVGLSPVEVDHSHWRTGRFLHDHLTARGRTPLLATGNIGMVGYYSELPLIDLHGLTDRAVARTPVAVRGHPGHEKWATSEYLRARGVLLGHSPRLCAGSRFREWTTVTIDGWPSSWPLCLVRWDRELAQDLRRAGFTVPSVEVALTRYVDALDERPPAQVAADLAWFDDFVFAGRPDPRRDRIVAWLAQSAGTAPD